MRQTTNSICELVRTNETKYASGTPTLISKYVQFDMYENINRIEAYINSKHTTGDYDSMDREKPFFNIVTAATNIWYRATDIDRKDIRIKATKSQDVLAAMLATIKIQDWMRRYNFGVFLNEWGRVLARYGSAVTKWIVKGGQLYASNIPWNRLIVDTIDFDNDVKIEVLEYTPAQLKMHKSYDQVMVDNLISSLSVRRTMDRQNRDTKAEFIRVYEVHGNIALSYLTGNEEDDDTFTQQMHVISYVEKTDKKGEYDDYTLYAGKEEKDPYMITHLIKEDGRTQAIGAVEHLFDAQWMQNWSVKTIKDQLDLASKLIFQTSDGNFVGQNALSAIENGDILIHEENKPLTQVANTSHDITSVQNFSTMWKSLGNEINGISESMLGQNPPSGTAWRQTEALLQESHSLFEIMTENKGLSMEDMLRIHIIPFVKTTLDTTDEVAATLDSIGVKQIEDMYVKDEFVRRWNNSLIEQFRGEGVPQAPDAQMLEAGIRGELNAGGNTRFFKPSEQPNKTWKEIFADLEWDVEVEITGEASDKQAAMTTLNTMLTVIAGKQGQPFSPEEKLVFNKILVLTGEVSPIEFSNLEAEKPLVQNNPAPQPVT